MLPFDGRFSEEAAPALPKDPFDVRHARSIVRFVVVVVSAFSFLVHFLSVGVEKVPRQMEAEIACMSQIFK